MVTSQELLQFANSNSLARGFFSYETAILDQYELMEEEIVYYWAGPITGWREDDRDRPDRPQPDYERPMDWQYEDEGYYDPYADRYEGSFGGQTWSYSDETLPERSPILG